MSDLTVIREEQRILKAEKDEAVRLWREGRAEIGTGQFITKDADRQVRKALESALLHHEWRDIEKAIREVSRDPYGSPYKIIVKAGDFAGRRHDMEALERRQAEDMERDRAFIKQTAGSAKAKPAGLRSLGSVLGTHQTAVVCYCEVCRMTNP